MSLFIPMWLIIVIGTAFILAILFIVGGVGVLTWMAWQAFTMDH